MKLKSVLITMLALSIVVISSCAPSKKLVVLDTNMGKIKMELYPKLAPRTVENFLELVKSSYYDNKIFHRVIEDFMIQTGGINFEGINEDVGYYIPDEINPLSLGMSNEEILALEARGFRYYTHFNSMLIERGVVAMANRGPNTGSSQFFIITAENGTPWLNGMHTAFGRVIQGMEVVDEISKVERNEGDRPIRRIVIRRAYIPFWPW